MAVVPIGVLWTIKPPAGLTPGGKVHQFRRSTVAKLKAAAQYRSEQALIHMQEAMAEQWNVPHPGEGQLRKSLRVKVMASQSGVSVQLTAGNFRHLPFITSLGGGNFHADPYFIEPHKGVGKGMLRFYWAAAGGIVRLPFVRHPGFGRDVMAEVAEEEGETFRLEMVDVVSNAIVELSDDRGTQSSNIRRR